MPQQALGGHDDQRGAEGAQHLASQQVEDLRRGGGDTDLDVVLGAQLQVALQAGRGVLRPLALEPVGEQHDQAAAQAPLGPAGGDELVDHHLGAVGEVAELGLPQDQGVGLGGGVAVLEGEHGLLGEHRVDDDEGALVGAHVLERGVALAVGLVVDGGMTVEEGPAPAVLAGQPHRVAGIHQGGVGHVLGEAPVRHLVAAGHLGPLRPDLGHPRVQLEPRRDLQHPRRQGAQPALVHPGVHGLAPVGAAARLPVHLIGALQAAQDRARHHHALLDGVAVFLDHALGLVAAEDAAGHQVLGVDRPRRGSGADLLVHHGLGHGGLVRLVVAQAAVADHIDDHVLAELVAEIERHAGDEDHRLGVVAIDVEDRGLNHLGHVGAIGRRAGIQRVAGGEADLVVDDDVHSPAGGVAAHLGQVEGLHDHALAGHRGVAVDDDGQDLLAGAVAAAVLAGPHRALDDRAYDLQVGGVEAQGQVDQAPGGVHVRGEAQVVFDVAGDLTPVALEAPLELAEDVPRRLAEDVGQDVEAPAVGHADDDLLDPLAPGALDQLVQQRDQDLAALQGEALLPDIAGVQVGLDALGGGQQHQQPAAVLALQFGAGAVALQALLYPALLLGAGDVHVFGADLAAVDLLDQGDDVPQAHPVRGIEGPGVEDLIQVRRLQVVVGRIEVGYLGPVAQLERVQVGGLVAAVAVGVDQAQHRGLLLGGGRLQTGGAACRGAGAALGGQAQEVLLHRAVGDLGGRLIGRLATDGVETPPPGDVYALRVL